MENMAHYSQETHLFRAIDVTGRGDDLPALLTVVRGEREPDAAVCTGDQHGLGGHGVSLLLLLRLGSHSSYYQAAVLRNHTIPVSPSKTGT
jgi:hypothetical protein